MKNEKGNFTGIYIQSFKSITLPPINGCSKCYNPQPKIKDAYMKAKSGKILPIIFLILGIFFLPASTVSAIRSGIWYNIAFICYFDLIALYFLLRPFVQIRNFQKVPQEYYVCEHCNRAWRVNSKIKWAEIVKEL